MNAARTAVEFAAVMAAVIAIQTLTAATQPRIGVAEGHGYDGKDYYSIATQLARGERPRAMARFAQRIGTPYLAMAVAPRDLMTGFTTVNVGGAFLSSLLLLIWFRRHLRTPWLRVALVILFASHWLQLVRFTFFYPVLVDAWAQVCCFAGLSCIAWYQEKPGRWPLAATAAVSTVGVFFRELTLLIPLAFLFARNPRAAWRNGFPYVSLTNAPRPAQWIPLVMSGLALLWIRDFIVPTDPAFSMADHFGYRAISRSLVTYLLGWIVAFGPALFVVAFDWRAAAAFFARNQALVVHMLGVAAIGWAASLESGRHAIYWATPVVYVLLGQTIERHPAWFRSPALVALLLAAQALTHRVFLATPQPIEGDVRNVLPTVVLTPLGDDASYLHLFPNYVAAETAWLQLAQFAVLGAIILIWIGRRAWRERTRWQRPACSGDPGARAGFLH